DLIQNISFSFALFCMLTGKILFLVGLSMLSLPLTSIQKIVLGLVIIVPICYVYFPLAINRFISTLILLFCIMISLMSNSLVDLIQNISFSFALFCMLTGKILFLVGLSMLSLPLTSIQKIVLGLVIIVPICYVYFPLAINRFISTLILLFCIMISLMSNSLVD